MTKTNLEKGEPFLRWAGSKRKILPKLKYYWKENFSTYIEPFVGSAQLYFAVNAQNAIINDINEELINTYRQIKSRPKEVFYFLSQFEPANKELFYKLRDIELTTISRVERAAVFIYLNRYCFNGLYRTNNSGKFNVPFAGRNTGSLPTLQELQLCSKHLSRTKIENCDFEVLIRRYAKSNDFVYLDPPYAVSNKRIFQQYSPSSFGINDIVRLKSLLKYMDGKKINFLLSYAYTNETKEYFSEWNKKRVITQRNISGFIKSRKNAAELLVTNIEI